MTLLQTHGAADVWFDVTQGQLLGKASQTGLAAARLGRCRRPPSTLPDLLHPCKSCAALQPAPPRRQGNRLRDIWVFLRRIACGSPSQPPPESTPESAHAYLFLFLSKNGTRDVRAGTKVLRPLPRLPACAVRHGRQRRFYISTGSVVFCTGGTALQSDASTLCFAAARGHIVTLAGAKCDASCEPTGRQ